MTSRRWAEGADMVFVTKTTWAPPPAFGHLPHYVGEGME